MSASTKSRQETKPQELITEELDRIKDLLSLNHVLDRMQDCENVSNAFPSAFSARHLLMQIEDVHNETKERYPQFSYEDIAISILSMMASGVALRIKDNFTESAMKAMSLEPASNPQDYN